ncbi:hypothetical protein AMECASPLE_020322 [Ameca splendens]|uniref:Uncharacterized protein n=1 Tax=Ameca splendens TaxID=208324 RepID=A0ABV1AAN3_9TELE
MHTNPHINPPTCLPQSTSTAFFHKANHFHWTSQPQTDLTSRSKGGMETLMSPLDQAFHEAGAKLHGHGPGKRLAMEFRVTPHSLHPPITPKVCPQKERE